jgi:hypothetical protein
MIVVWVLCIVFGSVNNDWSGIECYMDVDDDATVEKCEEYSAIYRITSIGVIIFAVQGVLSVFYSHFYDGFWIVKIIFFIGGVAGLLVPSSNVFDEDGFIWIARIFAFLFNIFLSTVLLDFGNTLKYIS